MKLTVLGSHLCPDTRNALALFAEKGVEVEFHNISEDLGFLKELLALRDTSPDYEAVRAAGGIGIPAMLFADGSLTRDTDVALAKLAQ